MAQAAVADPSAVDEEILQLGVAPLISGVHDVSAQERRSLPGLKRIKSLTNIGTKEQAQAIGHFHATGNLIDALVVMSKRQVQARMSQRQPRKCFADVTELSSRRT